MSHLALVEIEEDKLLVQVSESSDSEMIELDRQLSSPPLDQTTTDEEDFLLPELSREQIDVLLKVNYNEQICNILVPQI